MGHSLFDSLQVHLSSNTTSLFLSRFTCWIPFVGFSSKGFPGNHPSPLDNYSHYVILLSRHLQVGLLGLILNNRVFSLCGFLRCASIIIIALDVVTPPSLLVRSGSLLGYLSSSFPMHSLRLFS